MGQSRYLALSQRSNCQNPLRRLLFQQQTSAPGLVLAASHLFPKADMQLLEFFADPAIKVRVDVITSSDHRF